MSGRTALERIYRLLFTLVALLAAAPAAAEGGVVGTPFPVCVSPVRPGDTPAQMLRADNRYDCASAQTSFGSGDFWVRSAPLSTRAPFVRTTSLWQDAATLHILYADGRVLTEHMDIYQATHAMRLGAMLERALPARPAPVVRLLWHVHNSGNLRGIVVGARLITDHERAQSDLMLGSLYGAFAGLCIALIVYNLALWGALRHPFQLAYCGMVTGLLLYSISSSGVLSWAIPDISNNDRLRVNYAMLSVSAASALAFARSFFGREVFKGWIDRAATVVQVALLVAALVVVMFAPWRIWVLDRIFSTSFLMLFALVPCVLWRGWQRRSNYLWLFTISWAAPVLLGAARVAEGFHLIGWHFLLDNSTIMSMALEAMISSLAIAYRFRLIANERDEARERATAARLLADADPLTGLLNRRGFLHAAIGREQRHILVLADIDHFKSVNEALGHDGGDEVLRVIARALRSAAPQDALIARLGGEEFAVLAPDHGDDLADDVLAHVRGARMPFDMSVTVSLGTCTGPVADEQDWKLLYRHADQALFAAKSAGRDRVRHGKRPIAA